MSKYAAMSEVISRFGIRAQFAIRHSDFVIHSYARSSKKHEYEFQHFEFHSTPLINLA